MSGIYIHDMEMSDKKKTLTIFPDGRVYEHHGDRLWGHGEDCIPWKAISVPNHGRLGDLDALQKGGWAMQRTYQSGPSEMILETKRPTDFPTIIPADGVSNDDKLQKL